MPYFSQRDLENLNKVNISSTPISAAQWVYLGAMDQGVATSDSPTFAGETLSSTLTFTGATTVNQIKFPDNLADALSLQESTNKYITFITTDGDEGIQINKHIRLIYTAAAADDHALEIDANAAGYGDIKALDIDYITGTISAGEDEGIILINIDETAATGGDVFALEVLATDGSAGIYGLKAGPLVGPIHQDSGTFANPTTGTDNTADTDVPAMIDGSTGTTTAIFENNSEYIIIGAAAAFEDIEFILTTPSSKGIKPTFWYSTVGTGQFTQFTPVDGTDGFEHTGVVSWDASDLTGHVADGGTGTFDIKIIRTRDSITTTPILGYAKTAATTEYVWDENGDVNIRGLTLAGDIVMGGSYQVTGLQAPAGAGEAIRQTTNITETNLETLTDGSNADALHGHTTLSNFTVAAALGTL